MSLDLDSDELAGRLARDAHGRPVGEVETVFETDGARFVGIDTQRGRVVVPVDGAEADPIVYALDLPYMNDRIERAPTVAADTEELDPKLVRRVMSHFGEHQQRFEREPEPEPEPEPMPRPEPEPEPTAVLEPVAEDELPTAAVPMQPPPGEDEVLLREEQLVVETDRVPAQRVRVRKEIVEEQVTVTVTLRHEELVIEREPIRPGDVSPETAGGPRLDEPPIEIVLWAEEPVVSTRAVPVEKVRVLRTLGSRQQDLTAQLRHERASFDHVTGEQER